MRGIEVLWVTSLVWMWLVITAIRNGGVAAKHVVFQKYLPGGDDVYHHYRRIRGHREIPTRLGRRWQTPQPPISTVLTAEQPFQSGESYNSISFEQVKHNKRHWQQHELRRHQHEQQQHQQSKQGILVHQPQIIQSPVFFHSPNYTVVQAQTRTTAILHCEVASIGNNTVTWKRRRDYKILTFGILTYSSDSRFFARPEKNGKDWSLHIKYVQPDDAGLYECQVTSHPPASIFVDLQLVEARAEIIGGPDKIVKSGSPLILSCLLRRSTEQPEYIFWYHGERMINYDLGGGAAVRHGRQSSELLIPKADVQHAGNYSCVPSNAEPVSVNVHVLHSEKPAAMQHGSKNCGITINHQRKHDKFHLVCFISLLHWTVYHLKR